MNFFQTLAAFALSGLCYALCELSRTVAANARHASLPSIPQLPRFGNTSRRPSRQVHRTSIGELIGRLNFNLSTAGLNEQHPMTGVDYDQRRESEAIEILTVGEEDLGKPARDALRAAPLFRLYTANDPRALWLITRHQPVNVIVLHNTLTTIEMEETSRLIRHRWPHARILVVRAGDEFLEDALYDDRVLPMVDPDTLMETIVRLAEDGREGGSRHVAR